MALAVGAVGIAFGAFASDGGLSLAKALALSALVYGGSAQIAAVGVAAEGGTGGASVAAGLLLSARNVAFGVALAPLLPRPLGRRLAASQLVIDQSAAAALAQPRPDRAWRAFWLTGVWVLVLWLAGTAAGWALTGAIDIEALGIDAAIPALFLALLARAPAATGRGGDRPRRRRDRPRAGADRARGRPDPGGLGRGGGGAGAGAPADRRVSWAAILALAAGTYAMKAAGPVLLGGRRLPARLERVANLLPVAMFAALVVVETFAEGGELTLDARAAGRRAPRRSRPGAARPSWSSWRSPWRSRPRSGHCPAHDARAGCPASSNSAPSAT